MTMRGKMRKSLTIPAALIGVIVLASNGFGRQTGAYKPDGWQGLTLDKSAPEDAIRVLGQPLSDKSDRLHIHNIDKWVAPKHKQKIFRALAYKNAGEVKKAELGFLDNRLVRIYLEYDEKKFPAKDLRERFGVDFVLAEGGVPSDSTPSMYEGQKESLVPKVYPAAYYLVCVTPQSLISALVAGGRLKAVLKEMYRVKTKEPFPGSLLQLEIISRSLAKS
jgi:hypothetical protein